MAITIPNDSRLPPADQRTRLHGMRFTRRPDKNRGKVAAHWGETEVVEEVRRTKSGREYVRDVERPARQKTALVALRCPDCDHDQVLDMTTGEVWDLDSCDYTDSGSWVGA